MSVEIRGTDSGYEAYLDGSRVGELEYAKTDHRVDVLHTKVDSQAEGQGVGSALVRAVVAEARSNNWGIIATCPFTASWFDRHPEEADLRIG